MIEHIICQFEKNPKTYNLTLSSDENAEFPEEVAKRRVISLLEATRWAGISRNPRNGR